MPPCDGPVLVVTAIAMEAAALRPALTDLEPLDLGWGGAVRGRIGGAAVCLAHLGLAKANTAAGLALALRALAPSCVLQLGIGGTYAGAFLPVGAAAVASSEVNVDTGAGEGDAWQGLEAMGFALLDGPPPRFNEIPVDPDLLATLAAATGLPTARFATSDRVTGSLDEAERIRARFDVAVESMEGAAAAQVCLALGVPFGEIRGISNVVGQRDRSVWNVPGALRAAADAAARALRAVARERAQGGPG